MKSKCKYLMDKYDFSEKSPAYWQSICTAAKTGDAMAAFMLGAAYETGINVNGININLKKSFDWYKIAAKLGDNAAQDRG